MENINGTTGFYFILGGISDSSQFQIPVFILVWLIYILTFGGNMTIVLLVCLDHHLHSPMYFFLTNLSLLDMLSSVITLHRILIMFVTSDAAISYTACIAQMHLFASLATDELFLLTAMSYDRYVAICQPLRYTLIMNWRLCYILAIVSWVLGFLEISPLILLMMDFDCYRSNKINHFFCDPIQVTKLTCSDTYIFNIVVITEGILLLCFPPLISKCTSYVFIITTILRMPSRAGQSKAFRTCSSHLTVVLLLYITLAYQYFPNCLVENTEYNKVISLFNTGVLPILNPLIYSLKNKDVSLAVRRQIGFLKAKFHFNSKYIGAKKQRNHR